MTASRTIGLGLLIAAVATSTCCAGATDSISWRWSAWSPQAGFVSMPSLVGGVDVPQATAPARVIPETPPAAPSPLPSFEFRVVEPAARSGAVAAPSILMAAASQPAPVPAQLVAAPSASSGPVDAFVNLSDGPYPASSSVTTGTAMPWYLGEAARKVFGGVPTVAQRQDFANQVFAQVQNVFRHSGLNVSLTNDPTVAARHVLSVVSNTYSPQDSTAIGMTQVGGSGFTFIDKLSQASSVSELETVVANNVAHELGHALGNGGENPSHDYIDSGVANWNALASTQTVFSPDAVRLLTSDQKLLTTASIYADQAVGAAGHLDAASVPEPTTYLIWGGCLGLVMGARRSRARRIAS